MIQLTHRQFTVFQSVLYQTTSVVVQTNDAVIVVDPNLLPNEVETIRQFVEKVSGEKAVYLIFTHSDWDHIVGFGAFPNSTVIASHQFANNDNKQSTLEQWSAFDDEYYVDRPYKIEYPIVDIEVVEDGQTLMIGQTKLTFYLANGHTSDGIFTIIEPVGIWIAGDYLSDVEFPFIYDHSVRYVETLQKTDDILNAHNVTCLIPGHGRVTSEVEEIIQRKERSLHYIQQLKTLVQQGKESVHLIENYRYKKSLKTCHEENIQQIKREFNLI